MFISFGCARNQPLIALVYYKQRERVVRESKLRGKNTRIKLSFLSRNVTYEDPNSTYTKEKIYELIADYHDGRSSCFFSGTTWLIPPIPHKSWLIKNLEKRFHQFRQIGGAAGSWLSE